MSASLDSQQFGDDDEFVTTASAEEHLLGHRLRTLVDAWAEVDSSRHLKCLQAARAPHCIISDAMDWSGVSIDDVAARLSEVSRNKEVVIMVVRAERSLHAFAPVSSVLPMPTMLFSSTASFVCCIRMSATFHSPRSPLSPRPPSTLLFKLCVLLPASLCLVRARCSCLLAYSCLFEWPHHIHTDRPSYSLLHSHLHFFTRSFTPSPTPSLTPPLTPSPLHQLCWVVRFVAFCCE